MRFSILALPALWLEQEGIFPLPAQGGIALRKLVPPCKSGLGAAGMLSATYGNTGQGRPGGSNTGENTKRTRVGERKRGFKVGFCGILEVGSVVLSAGPADPSLMWVLPTPVVI